VTTDDPYDLERLCIKRGDVPAKWGAPPKVRKRCKPFIAVPMEWHQTLDWRAPSAALWLAQALVFQHWKGKGAPFKLTNAMLGDLPRYAKRRSLAYLECLGLIAVERHPRRAPIVTVFLDPVAKKFKGEG
jgi:hypothetical protein